MLRLAAGVVFCGLLSGLPVAWSEVHWDDSQVWNRARVLAPGQSMLSLRTTHRSYKDQFSDRSELRPLGQKYDRSISWRDLIRAEPSSARKLDLERSMRESGNGPDDVAATARFEVEREETGLGIDWAFGLSRGWTLGLRVPLSHRTIRSRSQIEVTPQLARGLGVMRNQPTDSSVYIHELARQSLSDSGYDELSDKDSSWQLGDVSMLNRLSLIDSPDWTWSMQNTVRFPTAPNSYASDFFADSKDEGQVDVGLSSLRDYRFRRTVMGWRIGYVAQLPDSARMRVRGSEIDPAVPRDLGDWAWSSLDMDVNFARRWSLLGEYGYMKKSANRYKGYPELAQRTEQELHVSSMGLRYEFDNGYRRQGVDRKWMAYAGYRYPWSGRNSADASRVSVELTAYY